eukprot:977578-Pyramimonas_sp.AAC.1
MEMHEVWRQARVEALRALRIRQTRKRERVREWSTVLRGHFYSVYDFFLRRHLARYHSFGPLYLYDPINAILPVRFCARKSRE